MECAARGLVPAPNNCTVWSKRADAQPRTWAVFCFLFFFVFLVLLLLPGDTRAFDNQKFMFGATCNSSSMNPYHQMIHNSFVIQKTFPDDRLPDLLLSLFRKHQTHNAGLEKLITSGTRHLLLVIRNSIPFTDWRVYELLTQWKLAFWVIWATESFVTQSMIADLRRENDPFHCGGEKKERTVNAQRGNFALLLSQGCNSC